MYVGVMLVCPAAFQDTVIGPIAVCSAADVHLLWTIHGLYEVSLMDADLQLSKVGAQCFCELVSCKIRQMVITKLAETPSPLFTIESTVDLGFNT